MGMKGYKAFGKGLICRGKQYAENKLFEEKGADSCCEAGVMHFCEEPLAVLNYYDLIDENGEMPEFAEVEALDEVLSDGDKRATRKIKIGARLNIKGLIEAQVKFVVEKCKCKSDESCLAASGDGSRLAASGDRSRIAASGDWSQLAASGYRSRLAASGDRSRLAASGNESQLAASGNWSELAASGAGSQLAASGDGSHIAASGNGSKLAASGNGSKLAASGNGSQLAASGKNSVVMACGDGTVAKGADGCWIALTEWTWIGGKKVPTCVKVGRVGEDLKSGVWYTLKDGEFVEVKE